MLRTLTTAALLALTVSAAQADSLSERIHTAACVQRVSATAEAKYQAMAEAKTKALTASN